MSVMTDFDAEARPPAADLNGAGLLAEIVALDRLGIRIEARRLELIAEAHRRGVTDQVAGLGTVSWLVANTSRSRRTAGASVRLALDLRDRLPLVGTQLREGTIGIEVAQSAASAIRDLPTVPTADRPDVEQELRDADVLLSRFADEFKVDDFARLARQVGAVITTQGGERTRRDQRAGRRLSLSQLLDGSWKLDGLFDTESGAWIAAALDSLSRPLGPDDERPAWARRADALVDLAKHHLDTGQAPKQGTVRPHLQISVDAEALVDFAGGWDGRDGSPPPRGQCGHASVPGSPLHRANAADVQQALKILQTGAGLGEIVGAGCVPRSVWERLLCDSAVRRVVIDQDSMPLDVGRASRYATPAQRAALIVRDRGCAHPGCHRPATWTDAHHIDWFLRDFGPTDLTNLVLLCRHHHGQVHDGDVQLRVDGAHLVFATRQGRELGRHRLRAGP